MIKEAIKKKVAYALLLLVKFRKFRVKTSKLRTQIFSTSAYGYAEYTKSFYLTFRHENKAFTTTRALVLSRSETSELRTKTKSLRLCGEQPLEGAG